MKKLYKMMNESTLGEKKEVARSSRSARKRRQNDDELILHKPRRSILA
jgi:hypothetical protein